MGIVVKLSDSRFSFNNPKDPTVFRPVANTFTSVMHEFEVEFAFDFDPDPKKGVGGSPAVRESWQVGIVQNVIFDRYRFDYEGGVSFSKEFTAAALDSSAQIYPPFYDDPVYVPLSFFDPKSSSKIFQPFEVPVAEILYTSQGYGELLDPWSATGVDITNTPKSVNMIDQPLFGARTRLSEGALIRYAECVTAFQIWLIAKRAGDVRFLAHVEPFSLVFWLEVPPNPGLMTLATPDSKFDFYGKRGIERIVHKGSASNAQIRMLPGKGSKDPVLSGETANTRAQRWLLEKGLVP